MKPAGLVPLLFALATAGAAAAHDPSRNTQAQPAPRATLDAPMASDPQRLALLSRGEAALAAGNADAAQASFDQASLMLHAGDTETALARTYMQAGHYRRALAFAAHAAGAHRDFPAAQALYAWLLMAGGQQAVAARQIAAALDHNPAQPLLLAVRDQLTQAWPLADGPLLAPPARLAPYANPLPASAAVVGSALLTDGGRKALAPANAVSTNNQVWLRNGLGQATRGTISRHLETHGLTFVLLDLRDPLPMPDPSWTAPRPPFPGSPGYTVEYTPSLDARPAWPLLRTGFLGRGATTGELPLLGIDAPPGPRGGPVFDAAGRLAGMTATDADGRNRWIPLSLLRSTAGEVFAPVNGPGARMAADQIYENGLRLALQVMVGTGPD